MEQKSPDAFRTISEVADWLGVPTHVLRFWESRFTQVKPVKRAGGRRYYRPADMLLLGGIRKLLHEDGLTIRGVQKLLREEGVKHVSAMSQALDMMPETVQSNVVTLNANRAEEEADAPVASVEDEIEDAEIIPDEPEETVEEVLETVAAHDSVSEAGEPVEQLITEIDEAAEEPSWPDEGSQHIEAAEDDTEALSPADDAESDDEIALADDDITVTDDTAEDVPEVDEIAPDQDLMASVTEALAASEDDEQPVDEVSSDDSEDPTDDVLDALPTELTEPEIEGSAPLTGLAEVAPEDLMPTPEEIEVTQQDVVDDSDLSDEAAPETDDTDAIDPDESDSLKETAPDEHEQPEALETPSELSEELAETETATADAQTDSIEPFPEPEAPVFFMPDLDDDPADDALEPFITPVAARLRALLYADTLLSSAELGALADRLRALQNAGGRGSDGPKPL